MKPVIFYGVQEKKYFKMNLHPEVEKKIMQLMKCLKGVYFNRNIFILLGVYDVHYK